jgi:Zn finger protein HypA/HybF involved in hydrogenase expression
MNLDQIPLDQLLNGGFAFDAPATPKTTSTSTGTSKQGSASDPLAAKTLESYHNANIARMREQKARLPELRRQLQQKRAEFASVDGAFFGPSIISSAQDIAILTNRNKLEKEIQELEENIHEIENGEKEADYFLRVGDILFSYTDAQDRIAAGQKATDPFANKKTRMPANSVYSYFAAAAEAKIEEAAIATAPVLTAPKKAAASELKTDIGFHRDKALETYLSALDPNNIQNDAAVISTIEENYGCCPVCDTEMFFNETFLDCSECGYREYILIDSEKPSYKDPPREMSYYAYKKINHLNEWLAQFQAKETTEIPAAVLDQIKTELRKERITDMSKLKVSKLKEVLKKLKLSRCYDHVAHILNRLNGISAPVLSREVEEKLRFMFKEIQFSFVKHCPKKRSNFLSYSFVLYKFCELLELDEYLPCFPLLKSREKLYMQDKIWQKICEDLDWEFHRTV